MWAHYGARHQGMVIGIDTESAMLEQNELCVLPARYGSIIYTASKPSHPYELSESEEIRKGRLEKFDARFLEALQRAFLHKSSEWAYEEEVRIVKKVEHITADQLDPTYRKGLAKSGIFLHEVPKSAIRSVHLGAHALSAGHEDAVTLMARISAAVPHAELKGCEFDKTTWAMKDFPLENWSRIIDDWYYPRDR